ncbi:hypothetical protein GCM10011573_38700 [Enterococcus wangshanyuanii]|uniref:Uncharacterized protein n=1 Tax=Enterococcus wangshanyuanii TaxID=2005703 RepID=A0ABQ1PWI7_9ENTE|nr:hypothetical protein GCM10011573_38700 [Enterococcus wangshanyuanii]
MIANKHISINVIVNVSMIVINFDNVIIHYINKNVKPQNYFFKKIVYGGVLFCRNVVKLLL